MAPNSPKAHSRPVDDEPLVAQLGPYDYADSFAIRLDAPTEATPEDWMRAAIGGSPRAIQMTVGIAWRYLLRFELHGGPGQLFGMPIIESTPDLAYMRGDSPLLVGHLIGRRAEPTLATLTTVLIYRQARLAAPMWATAGPAHRRIAPYLLERVASSAA